MSEDEVFTVKQALKFFPGTTERTLRALLRKHGIGCETTRGKISLTMADIRMLRQKCRLKSTNAQEAHTGNALEPCLEFTSHVTALELTDFAEAEHKRITLENKIRQEAIFGKELEATFDDACVRYIKDRAAPLRAQMNRNLQVILKEAGHWKLREITPAMVRSLAVKLFPDCKPQSRNANAITPISAVLGHAHQCGMCGPIRIKRFKIVDERIASPADSDWIDAFMRHAPLRIAAFELFCFTTAARPQEACNLRPDQLHLDEGIARGGITKNGKAP